MSESFFDNQSEDNSTGDIPNLDGTSGQGGDEGAFKTDEGLLHPSLEYEAQ